MGLDMYFEKRTYVKNWEHMKPEERHSITIKRNSKPVAHIKTERITAVTEEIGYLRKVNCIHHWIVQNVQEGVDDCRLTYLSHDVIAKLLETVTEVLKHHTTKKALELLPPQEGFFFGSTEVDEWYWKDLEEAKRICEDMLKEPEGSFYYQSSW